MNQVPQNPPKVKQRICRDCRKKYLEMFLSSMETKTDFSCCYIGEGIKSTLEFLSSSSKFQYMLDYIIHLTKYFTVCTDHQQVCEIYEFNQAVIDPKGKLLPFSKDISFKMLCKKCLIELINKPQQGQPSFYYTREELNEKFEQQNQIQDKKTFEGNQQIVLDQLKKVDFELVEFEEFKQRLENYNITTGAKQIALDKLKKLVELHHLKPEKDFDKMYEELVELIKNFEERKIIMAEGNNHKYIHDPTIDQIDLKSDLISQIDIEDSVRKELFQYLGELLGEDKIYFKEKGNK
ncbi:hypothetical protein pb186bvf_007590 [Paramecium bursaria]